MDMNSLPLADAIVNYIDVETINEAIKNRAEALGNQLNPEAAAQFVSDMSSYKCTVTSEGSSIAFHIEPEESYLIKYLADHDIPVAGGDNGTVHNVDGSTKQSKVPEALWGTELPWYEMPEIEGKEEVKHLVEIMGPDAANVAAMYAHDEIASLVAPYVEKEVVSMIGGVM